MKRSLAAGTRRGEPFPALSASTRSAAAVTSPSAASTPVEGATAARSTPVAARKTWAILSAAAATSRQHAASRRWEGDPASPALITRWTARTAASRPFHSPLVRPTTASDPATAANEAWLSSE